MADPTDKDDDKDAVKPTATTPLAVNKGVAPSLNLAPTGGALAPKGFPNVLAAPTPAVAGDTEEAAATARLDAAREAELAVIKKRSLETAKLTATADAEQARSDIAAAEKEKQLKEDAKKFRPPEFKPITYNAPKPPTLIEQLGSSTMLFAMLGGLFTRTHATTALNAATGALNGFKEGNEIKAKQALEQWKTANENMLQAARFQQEVYNNVMKDVNDRVQYEKELNTAKGKERTAKLKAAALAFDDQVLVAQTEREQAKDVYAELERRRKLQDEHQENTIKMKKQEEEAEADKQFKAKLDAGELDNLNSADLARLAASGSPKAKAWANSTLVKTQAAENKLTTAKETPEFQEAKKNNDYATMDTILADAGDKEAKKRVSKRVADESKRLTPDVQQQLVKDFKSMNLDYEKLSAAQKRTPEYLAAWHQAQEEWEKEGHPLKLEETFRERRRALDRITAGPEGNAIRSLDVVHQHLDVLKDAFADLKKISNKDIASLNSWAANLGRNLNNPAISSFDTVRKVLPIELQKAISGAGIGTGKEREEFANILSTKLDEKAMKATIDTLESLITGQTMGYYGQFGKVLSIDEIFSPNTAFYVNQYVKQHQPKQKEKEQSGTPAPGSAPAPGAAPKAFTIPSVGEYPAASVAQWIKNVRAMPGRENMTDEQLVEEFKKQLPGGGK